jgi:hypothetical protein
MICFFFGHQLKEGYYTHVTEQGGTHIRSSKYCTRKRCTFRMVWIDHLQEWARTDRIRFKDD